VNTSYKRIESSESLSNGTPSVSTEHISLYLYIIDIYKRDWFFQSLHFDDEILNNDQITPGVWVWFVLRFYPVHKMNGNDATKNANNIFLFSDTLGKISELK
jgi:hypothetical protein